MSIYINIILYVVIGALVTLAASVLEMHDKGYVELSLVVGVFWPISIILIFASMGFVGLLWLFGFMSESLEVIATKIAEKLNISVKHGTSSDVIE